MINKEKVISYLVGFLVVLFAVFANGKYQKSVGYGQGLEQGRELYAVDRAEVVQAILDKHEAEQKVLEYEIKKLEKNRLTELYDNAKLSELDKLRAINELLRQP